MVNNERQCKGVKGTLEIMMEERKKETHVQAHEFYIYTSSSSFLI